MRNFYSRLKAVTDPRDILALEVGLVVAVVDVLAIGAAIAWNTPSPVRPTSVPAASCGSCPLPHPQFPSVEVADAGGKAR